MWPAQRAGRWRSPTASTSATPRSPRSRGSSRRRSRGWRGRARCSASRSSRATCRSTTRQPAARSRPRRSSAASVWSRTCGTCPEPGARATSSWSRATAGWGSTGRSTRRCSWTGPAGRPPPPDYVAEAALVHLLWRSAPALSAAHDVSAGGLAVALAELALHSGLGAEIDLGGEALAWFGEGAGRAVLACSPERVDALEGVPVRRLGTVGGDKLLGVPLAELRAAYEEGSA